MIIVIPLLLNPEKIGRERERELLEECEGILAIRFFWIFLSYPPNLRFEYL